MHNELCKEYNAWNNSWIMDIMDGLRTLWSDLSTDENGSALADLLEEWREEQMVTHKLTKILQVVTSQQDRLAWLTADMPIFKFICQEDTMWGTTRSIHSLYGSQGADIFWRLSLPLFL